MKNLVLVLSVFFMLALVGCSKDIDFCEHESELNTMEERSHGDFDGLIDLDDKGDDFGKVDDDPAPGEGEDGITDDDDEDDDDELEDEVRS